MTATPAPPPTPARTAPASATPRCSTAPRATTRTPARATTPATPAASGTVCADDGNVCSADACDGSGRCIHPPANAGTVCRAATDVCDAAQVCTGTSVYCPPDTFQPTNTPCDDGNACTFNDVCDGSGQCAGTALAGCTLCSTAADCNDQNACTTDSCSGGVCQNTALAGCTPCTTAADCDDQNACTTESCGVGVCHNGPIPGCTPCLTTADCDDQDACTQDLCTAGACTHTPLDNCAAPAVEICGDCIDNDGNGLTDFEDPACCTGQVQRFTMDLKRGRIRARGVTSRLRLRSILARAGMSTVNPQKQDVFLQIRPEGGTDVLCARVPAAKFMHKHHVFKFWDRKHLVASAQGIDDMRIKVRRNGSLRFRTTARHAQTMGPHSDRVEITVGFLDPAGVDANNQCSAVTKAFRTSRHGALIVP